MRADLGLFILWPSLRRHADSLLADLSNHFTVKRVYDLHWTPELFFLNCYRFYGERLSTRSVKEKLGVPAPLRVFLFEDRTPRYEVCATARGLLSVNSSFFNLKTVSRKKYGTKFGIHGSNNAAEVTRDLALLLGLNLEDFLKNNSGEWDGNVKTIKRDISGSHGWSDLSELFYILNAAEPYVILRNFEKILESDNSEEDIDFLVLDSKRFAYTTNAKKLSKGERRVNHSISIAGRDVLADLRIVGDGYFDRYWQKDLMKRRVLHSKGYFTPNDEDAFYSLLYHILIHKTAISEKYKEKVPHMASLLGLNLNSQRDLTPSFKEVLFNYMKTHDYEIVEPGDITLRFNQEHSGGLKISRERRLRNTPGLKGRVKRLIHRLTRQ